MTGDVVTVTGGAGFLGGHIVGQLVSSGRRVRVFDRAEPLSGSASTGVEFITGDVRDREAVRRAVRGAAAVVHAAFAPPQASVDELRAVNVDGTANVLAEASGGGAAAVVAVSSTIVERTLRTHPFLARSPMTRLVAYAEARRAAERLLLEKSSSLLTTTVVRPKTFVGPGRVGGFGLLFAFIHDGGAVPLLGPGDVRYQLVDVRDLAAGIVRLVDRPLTGEVGFGATTFRSVAEEVESLIAHAGTGSYLRPLPPSLGRPALRAIELAGLTPLAEWHNCVAQGVNSEIDTSRARNELGWAPAFSNAQSLADAYDWFAAQQDRNGASVTTRPVPLSHRALRRVAAAVLG